MSNVIEFSIKAIDGFSSTVKSATSSLSGLEKGLLGAAAAGTVYAAINLAQQSIDNADAMGDAAAAAGIAVEQFSALSFAADLMGSSGEAMATGIRMLNKALGESLAVGPATDAFRGLGVETKTADGQLRDTVDVLFDVADAFAASKDGAVESAYAMAIFGKSGTALLPTLNAGSDAIKAMMEQAKILGVVVTDDFAKSAGDLNDNLDMLSTVIAGSFNVAMADVAPVIGQLTGQLVRLSTEGQVAEQAGRTIATAMRLLMSAGIGVVGAFKTVGDILGGVFASIAAAAQGEFSQAFKILSEVTTDVGSNITGTMTEIGNVWDEAAAAADRSTASQLNSLRTLGNVSEEEKERQKNAAKEAQDAETARIDAIKSSLESLGAILETIRTPLEDHEARLQAIQDVRALMTDGQFDAAMAAENARWEEARAAVEWYGVSVLSVSTLIGDAMAKTLVDGASLATGLMDVAKNVLKTLIGTYIQMGAQRLILSALDQTATATEASTKMGAALGQVYLNSFASAAAIPVTGFVIAPGVAAANSAAAAAGAAAAIGTGAALGGIAHGGMDYVPSESTFLLDKGERVLSPRQNQDLTDFLNGGGSGGGVTIQNLTIHVMENATNVEAFARMDKVQLREVIGYPILDALNEMSNIGITPNFARAV